MAFRWCLSRDLSSVVVGPTPVTAGATERPLVEGAASRLLRLCRASTTRDFPEALVTGDAAGVVFARLGVVVAVRSSRTRQHPSAEDRPHSWKREDDLGTRVLLKMRRQRGLEFGDRRVQLRDVGDGRFRGDAVGVFEKVPAEPTVPDAAPRGSDDPLVKQRRRPACVARLDAGLGECTTLVGVGRSRELPPRQARKGLSQRPRAPGSRRLAPTKAVTSLHPMCLWLPRRAT